MVSIAQEQNIICSKTRLDGTTHEQTIICKQLFVGHVVGSRTMERQDKNASNDNVHARCVIGKLLTPFFHWREIVFDSEKLTIIFH